MPRTKYVVTAADLNHASSYLETQLLTFAIASRDNVTHSVVVGELREATARGTKAERARSVNEWCEKHLSSVEWRKLKAAIRKRRQRWERYEEQKTVTISTRAHRLLTNLSKRDDVTFSEVMENYLGKAVKNRGRAPR
ncbi:MAG: hypothetical protein R3C53_19225 [Pirellulaceae bacterium]